MVNRNNKSSVTISERTIRKKGGVVILPLKEYEKLRERVVSTYYLKGREAEKLDRLVEKGLKDYREDKCKLIKSLADLD